jgi:hypothetical protein
MVSVVANSFRKPSVLGTDSPKLLSKPNVLGTDGSKLQLKASSGQMVPSYSPKTSCLLISLIQRISN